MKVLYLVILPALLFLATSVHLSARTFNDPEDLQDAVNASINGGLFIVENGTYKDFEATFEVMATESNPVVIKAETIGGVTLTGESQLVFKKSAFVTLEGFVFDGRGEDNLMRLKERNFGDLEMRM